MVRSRPVEYAAGGAGVAEGHLVEADLPVGQCRRRGTSAGLGPGVEFADGECRGHGGAGRVQGPLQVAAESEGEQAEERLQGDRQLPYRQGAAGRRERQGEDDGEVRGEEEHDREGVPSRAHPGAAHVDHAVPPGRAEAFDEPGAHAEEPYFLRRGRGGREFPQVGGAPQLHGVAGVGGHRSADLLLLPAAGDDPGRAEDQGHPPLPEPAEESGGDQSGQAQRDEPGQRGDGLARRVRAESDGAGPLDAVGDVGVVQVVDLGGAQGAVDGPLGRRAVEGGAEAGGHHGADRVEDHVEDQDEAEQREPHRHAVEGLRGAREGGHEVSGGQGQQGAARSLREDQDGEG